MSRGGIASLLALALAGQAACGRLGYDPLASAALDDGGRAPADGARDGDAGFVRPDAGATTPLPAGCLVVTTAADEDDPGELRDPPHLGAGLSLREAIELENLEPGPGCVGFTAPLALSWTTSGPPIDDPLDVYGGGSVLADVGNIAFGLVVEAGGAGSSIRDVALDSFDVGIEVKAAGVTVGPGVEARGSNLGLRLRTAGSRITGARVRSTAGSAIQIDASDSTVERTVVFDNGGVGIDTGTSVAGLTVRHVTVHGGTSGISLRTNSTGVVVRNVIVTSASNAAIDVSGPTDLDADHVNSYGNGVDCSGCTLGPSSIFTDPVYLDAAANDFRLAPGSPAIDVGVDTGLDVNGSSPGRFDGAGPDLGAHER